MPVTKAKKKELLEKVSVVAKAPSIVFVNFHALTVADATTLRRQLREAGVSYVVAKKTLTKKAFAEKKFAGEMPEIEGELALAYTATSGEGSDTLAPAREIYGFEKKFDGRVSIAGGVFDASYKSKDEMTALATIPSRHTLLGMFVNLINSPIQRVVIALSEVAKTKTA